MSSAGKIAAVVFAGLAIALAVARLKNVRGGVLEPLPTADKTVFQAGKYFIVTGANSGIGARMTAIFAGMGGNVVMACRSLEKANAARERIVVEAEEIALQYGHKAGKVEIMQLDIASRKSIENFVNEYHKSGKPLNVLVNNAGLATVNDRDTEDGLRIVMGVNHFGVHYLTSLLLPDLLPKSVKDAPNENRIVLVASDAHIYGSIDLEDLDLRGIGGEDSNIIESFEAYAVSKLANIIETRALAKRLAGSGVTVNCVHPGFIATEISREATGWLRIPYLFAANIIAMDVNQGAQNSVWAATSPLLKGKTGGYYKHFTLTTPKITFKQEVPSESAEDIFWAETCKITKTPNFQSWTELVERDSA